MAPSSEMTVIVPTYNGAQHLRATLDSLAAQTVRPYVVVIDDGSSDDSADVAESHPAVDRCIRQRNRGVAAARNRGLAVATTEFVAFLDQDDLWHSTRTKTLLTLLDDTGAVCVGTTEQPFALATDRPLLENLGDGRTSWAMEWIDTDGEASLLDKAVGGSGSLMELDVRRLMQGAVAMTTSFAYQREAAIVAGGCAPFVRAADDHVLNVNIANIFGAVTRLDSPSLLYRVHPEATTQVSPLVLPVLTLQLALRYGRALPREADLGPNLEHLIWQIADDATLSRSEQHALLTLSTSPASRARWRARWAKRSARRAMYDWRSRSRT